MFNRLFNTKTIPLFTLTLAILIRVIYLFLIPPGQTPDETFIFQRLWNTTLGIHAETDYPNSEYYQPPLYFFLSSLVLKGVLIFKTVPDSTADAYIRFYHLLRIISLVLSSLTLVLAWKIINKLSLEISVKLTAFILLSLLPTYSAFAIAPNMNVLLFFLVNLTIYLLFKDSLSFNNYRLATLSGITFGLAVLTKFEALVIAPPLFIFAVLSKKGSSGKFLAFFLVAAFICGGWWYFQNLITYGWFYNVESYEATISEFAKPFSENGYIFIVLGSAFITFFATFGVQNQIFLQIQAYLMFLLVISATIVGFIKSLFTKKAVFMERKLKFLYLAFLINLAIFFLENLSHTFQAQGRHLYSSLIFISVTISVGISAFFNNKSQQIPFLLLILGLLSNFWGYYCIVDYFYNLNLPINFSMCVIRY